MGLAIDGNVVHGIAKGGQPFLAMQTNKDGTINLGGQDYFSTNKIKITDTGDFDLGLSIDASSGTIDVTDNLVNYRGYFAILEISTSGMIDDVIARPISIPTTPTTDSLSFYSSYWSGSLSKTTDNSFTLAVSYNEPGHYVPRASGKFYILSNKAS